MDECDAALQHLLRRCSDGGGDRTDWTDLYRLVASVLMRCNAPEMSALPEDRAYYVQTYFAEKLLPSISRCSGLPEHRGALVFFFRRYLIQHIRATHREQETHLTPAEFEGTDVTTDLLMEVRECTNKSLPEAAAVADEFIRALRAEVPPTHWLLFRHCHAARESQRLSVNQARSRFGLPNAYENAKALGLPLNEPMGVGYFESTRIGRSIVGLLGYMPGFEDAACVLLALEILSLRALSVQE